MRTPTSDGTALGWTPEFTRKLLAVLFQHPHLLDGVGDQLEPSLFGHRTPTSELLRLYKEVAHRFGEPPSVDTFREILLQRAETWRPEFRTVLLKTYEELAATQVSDPKVVVERAAVRLHNKAAADLLVKGIDAVEDANLRDVKVDLSPVLERWVGPEPSPSPTPEPPGDPAPALDVERLCEVAPYFGQVKRAFQETTDAPFEFLIGAGLAAAAAALGKGYYVATGTDRLFPNLWLLQLGPSSSPRKTTSLGIVHRLRHETGGEWILPRAGSPEGFIQALADRGGSGVQLISEFGGWLKAMGRNYMAGHREVLTELYDSIPIFEQQRTKKAVGRGPKVPDVDVVRYPSLSIVAASTPAWVNANLSEADLHSGFLARFLFIPMVVRRRPKLLATERQPPHPEALAAVIQTLKQATPEQTSDAHSPILPGVELRLKAEAMFEYQRWARRLAPRSSEATPFCERLENSVLKISLICAVLRGGRQWIGQADMEGAIVLGQYFAQAVDYLLTKEVAFGRDQQARQKVLRIIREKGDISRSDLLCRSRMLVRDFDQVISTLLEEGAIKEKEVRRGISGRGRFGKVYSISAETTRKE